MNKLNIVHGDPSEIADQLDATGVVCLENAVPAEWLSEARANVRSHLLTHGETDHFILAPYSESHSSAQDFLNSPAVKGLLTDIVRERFPRLPEEAVDTTASALRVIAGPSGEGDAWWFHYDASVVTVVVPLFLPDAGRGTSGEFIGFLNKRPFRRFVLTNIVEKFFAQSSFCRKLILRRLARQDDEHIVDMKVGNIYLFWGYRTLHGNMPCTPGALRATLLLFFGRPHGDSQALDWAVQLQQTLRSLRQKPADAVEPRLEIVA